MAFTSSEPNSTATGSLPTEATWEELSERFDMSDSEDFESWIDASLSVVQQQHIDFESPKSRQKSLVGGR